MAVLLPYLLQTTEAPVAIKKYNFFYYDQSLKLGLVIQTFVLLFKSVKISRKKKVVQR